MDHAQCGSGIEPVPVSGHSSPSKIISQESIIACVGIHDAISPNAGTMSYGVSLSDFIFDVTDYQHISMIVLLQELKVETVSDLTC
jgi:hypothetical protein